MKYLKIVLLFLVIINLGSCITQKDLVYLQDKNGKYDGIQLNPIDPKPYRVQVNDILSIQINAMDAKLVELFSQSNAQNQNVGMSEQGLYFNGYSVDTHGNIRMPVFGYVNVLGFTLDEIRLEIEKRLLNEFFTKEAKIFVNVNLAGLRYTINGEIGSPGTNVVFQDKVTILEAIANSGDITVTGNRKEVQIIRKHPTGFETITLDLTDKKLLSSQDLYIQPNDYIYIKPLKQKSWGTGTTAFQTIGTIMTAMSLITTSLLLFRNL